MKTVLKIVSNGKGRGILAELAAAVFLGAVLALPARAQEAESPPPPDAVDMVDAPAVWEDAAPPPPPGGMRTAVDRWMLRLRNRDPQEYERMKILQEQNPEAFKRVLVEKLRKHRMRGLRMEPELQAFLEDGRGPPPPPPPGGATENIRHMTVTNRRGANDIQDPRLDELNREAKALIKAYKAAADEDARAQLREELHAKLIDIFELRMQHQQKAIVQAEEGLAKLKDIVRKRQERRDEIVDRHMESLLEADVLKW